MELFPRVLLRFEVFFGVQTFKIRVIAHRFTTPGSGTLSQSSIKIRSVRLGQDIQDLGAMFYFLALNLRLFQ